MNLIPMPKLWMRTAHVMKTAQIMKPAPMMRIRSIGYKPTGPDGTNEKLEQNPDETIKIKINEVGKVVMPTPDTPEGLSFNDQRPIGAGIPATDTLYMMADQKTRMLPRHPRGVVNKDIVSHLTSYFDDQIMYYKTMANYNKAAMKRIKKIKKKWNRLLD